MPIAPATLGIMTRWAMNNATQSAPQTTEFWRYMESLANEDALTATSSWEGHRHRHTSGMRKQKKKSQLHQLKLRQLALKLSQKALEVRQDLLQVPERLLKKVKKVRHRLVARQNHQVMVMMKRLLARQNHQVMVMMKL